MLLVLHWTPLAIIPCSLEVPDFTKVTQVNVVPRARVMSHQDHGHEITESWKTNSGVFRNLN